MGTQQGEGARNGSSRTERDREKLPTTGGSGVQDVHRGQERVPDLLKLELQSIVSCPILVVVTKLQPSEREATNLGLSSPHHLYLVCVNNKPWLLTSGSKSSVLNAAPHSWCAF